MDARVWQRYIAVACSQAWKLDVNTTEELLRCVEALVAAAPVTGSATVKVLLGTGVAELVVEGRGEDLRIAIRARQSLDLRTGPASAVPPEARCIPPGRDGR